jgi:hypothetical protein
VLIFGIVAALALRSVFIALGAALLSLLSAWDALILGILPAGAAGFLGWIVARSLQAAPATQTWPASSRPG